MHSDSPTPKTGPVTPAESTPRPTNSVGWGARKRRLTDTEVAELRENYRWRRELADAATDPAEWETITETLERMAAASGGLVTPSALNRLVLGESYKDAPGPLDLKRLALRSAVNPALGAAAASRARSRFYGGASLPSTPVTVTITRPGEPPRDYVYPAGTTVTLTTHNATEPATEPDADTGGMPAKPKRRRASRKSAS